MTVAERTREAVRAEPFLHEALRAGVLNYTAAARYLGIRDEEAVAAALRRYEAELEPRTAPGDARVSMKSGVGQGQPAEAILQVGDVVLVPGAGALTGVLATGEVEILALRCILGRCETAGIDLVAAGATDGTLVVAVDRMDGADAVRAVEDALES